MSFFGKLKDRLFKSSSKLDEGLDAIVQDGGTVEAADLRPTPIFHRRQTRTPHPHPNRSRNPNRPRSRNPHPSPNPPPNPCRSRRRRPNPCPRQSPGQPRPRSKCHHRPVPRTRAPSRCRRRPRRVPWPRRLRCPTLPIRCQRPPRWTSRPPLTAPARAFWAVCWGGPRQRPSSAALSTTTCWSSSKNC